MKKIKLSKFTDRFIKFFEKVMQVPCNLFSKNDLYYIVEPANWVIKQIGINITNNLPLISSKLSYTQTGIRNAIVHYGSKYTFFNKDNLNLPHKSNSIVVTCHHISAADTNCIKLFPRAIKFVNIWHTSCTLTKNSLVNLGVPEMKIAVIPLGVDLNLFSKPTDEEKKFIRNRLGLPQTQVIVGSFQKDGVGWAEGMQPKMIKGPDIFCEVVEGLSKKFEIFVLLTGPSRGYVKERLNKARIPYFHFYLKNSEELATYYKAIDLYLVTSRVEGGPQAIVESLASGVPLISTKVGMAPDVIRDGQNGFIVDIEDTEEIIKKASMLIEDKHLREKLIINGLENSKAYDWKKIAQQYEERIYSNLKI